MVQNVTTGRRILFGAHIKVTDFDGKAFFANHRIDFPPIVGKIFRQVSEKHCRTFEEGAKSRKAMADKIDTNQVRAPSFLMVLTETGDYAYRRQDGVCVVPIGCLKN